MPPVWSSAGGRSRQLNETILMLVVLGLIDVVRDFQPAGSWS